MSTSIGTYRLLQIESNKVQMMFGIQQFRNITESREHNQFVGWSKRILAIIVFLFTRDKTTLK